MAFIFSVETVSSLAFWTGATVLGLTGALLLWFIFLRLWLLARQKQRNRTLQRWRPLLMSSLYQQPEGLPPLSRFDLPHMFELWNHLYDSLDDEARNSLSWMAGQVHMPAAVSRMLRRKDFYACHLAIRTAGNLRLASAWDALRELLASGSPALSIAAARALTQIDTLRAMPLLMHSLIGRTDWHPGAVTEIFHIAGAGQVVPNLLQAILDAPVDKTWQLIRQLAEIAPDETQLIVSSVFTRPDADVKLLNTCLDVLNTPEELEKVRLLTRHDNWHVRVHAAKALGRLGAREDGALLENMLGDGQWWVRYRAAQALSRLPGMNTGELLHIKDTQTDRDARDMLHQVMAEQALRESDLAAQHG
ncbi:MAG: HEAT repeat domain-containing protein [Gammaproteobacteria bacterium]|nr:HEAT repeat domain-containing protein [Gammaproteobacteria bacterium]MBU1732383.1 HEAT repeat domain-containing protein [Gammaproteobacteria bacterium]MBU1893953.1 HEAT repeat domain-containing protein [Gammaproteobacteria bacterium]